MKQFIVLAAILPIILTFIAQFALEEAGAIRMSSAGDAIRAFCIEAAYYGGGGAAEADALRNKLAMIFQTDPGEIFIGLSQADEAHIDWEISFPVGDIMAGAGLMGITAEENRGRSRLSGVIVIAPKPPEIFDPSSITEDPDDEFMPYPDIGTNPE